MGIFDRIASNLGGEAAGVAPIDQRDALQMGLLVSGLQALAGAGTQGIDAVPQGLLSGLEAFRGTLGRAQQRDRRDELVDLDRRRVGVFEQKAQQQEDLLLQAEQNRERLARDLSRRLAVNADLAAQLKEGFDTGPFSDDPQLGAEVDAIEFSIVRAAGRPTEDDFETIQGHIENFIERSGELQDAGEEPVPREVELAQAIGRTLGPDAEQNYLRRVARGGNSDNDLLVAAIQGDPEARSVVQLKRAKEGEPEGSDERIDVLVDSVMQRQAKVTDFPPATREDIQVRRAERGLSFPIPEVDELRAESVKMEVILAHIDDYSLRINTEEGLAAIASGNFRNFASKFNLDPDVTVYKDSIASFRSFLARGLGHSGVLTAQDVADAMAITPRLTDSKEIRDAKMAAIRGMFTAMRDRQAAIFLGTEDERRVAAEEQDKEILGILNTYRGATDGGSASDLSGLPDDALFQMLSGGGG